MIKQNLHTHSTYCDGKDTITEMIETAIEKGFTKLGFSGHIHVGIDDGSMSEQGQRQYIEEVLQKKEEYKDKIEIYLGIEQDTLARLSKKDPFEYIIGSVHFLEQDGQYMPVDYDEATSVKMIEQWFDNDFLAYAKQYYKTVAVQADWEEVDIIGHIDLLTKYNESEKYISFTNPEYIKAACDCIDALVSKGKMLEVNTGAIARGYRKTPYPERHLLQYIYEKGGKIMLNSDCHNRFKLDCDFENSMNMIKKCGFKTMITFTDEGFKELPIEEFTI